MILNQYFHLMFMLNVGGKELYGLLAQGYCFNFSLEPGSAVGKKAKKENFAVSSRFCLSLPLWSLVPDYYNINCSFLFYSFCKPFYYCLFQTDIWNVGWVIFEMAVCRSPDLGKLSCLVKQSSGRFPDLDELVTKCTREIVPGGRREVFKKFPDLKELVTNCIQFFPASRPTIFQVINILKEYFMSP